MNEELRGELENRFRAAAEGRKVTIRFESADSLFARDYHVTTDDKRETFAVTLRRGGCFEGAYRCIERFIHATVDEADGKDHCPEGWVDARKEGQYWIAENIYERFRSDLDSAIAARISEIQRGGSVERSGPPVNPDARADALAGVGRFLKRLDDEVRGGVLSPTSVELWKNIGLDVFSEAEGE